MDGGAQTTPSTQSTQSAKLENPEDNEVATVKVEVTKVNMEQSV